MLVVISPAKTLDLSKQELIKSGSTPVFLQEAQVIADVLKKYKPTRLGKLMNINPKLAQLNFERYQEWDLPESDDNAKQALLCFKGEVYNGINANEFKIEEFEFAQNHVRILSGLYGILKPLDRIKAYRLEMGTKLNFRRIKNLYEYWGNKISDEVKKDLQTFDHGVLVNLASNEYFKAIKTRLSDTEVITPDFREYKNGEYKFVHVLGKKARGLMVKYIIKNEITDPEQMKLFDYEGYEYNDRLSQERNWVFTRG